jgi:putative ABC transport system ATP-binding protein
MSTPVLSLQDIKKVYTMGDSEFWALKGVSFDIQEGEMVALMGPSGSGKSTLMNIIGILDKPSERQYLLRGEDVSSMDEIDRAEIRNAYLGFVFQAFHLLPRLNLLENVEVPLTYAGYAPRVRRKRAMNMLTKVGLADKWRNLPSQISGGQKQRVAVARALSMNPALLLADEPTGNLDTKTGQEIMTLFHELNDEGVTVLIVTHENEIAEQTKRIIRLRDGILERDEINDPRRHILSESMSVGGVAA